MIHNLFEWRRALWLTFVMMLPVLNATALHIELDLKSANELHANPLAGGGVTITTTGGDPYVMSLPITSKYNAATEYILSFEYSCAEELGALQLFYGPPMQGNQSVVGQAIRASKEWTVYELNIKAAQTTDSWRDGYKQFRLDFGNDAGRTILIRNIQLSAPNARKPAPFAGVSYLENDQIRLGADLSIGGSITYLSTKTGPNMINSSDWGRQIQMSFYSGPQPFEPNGKKPRDNWKQLGWNPIQSGDCYWNASEVLEHRNNGKQIYVKCRPMHWPLNNQPGQCIFECLYSIEGNAVHVKSRLINARDDKTQYPGRDQELPALYSNGPWYRIMTYTGDKPYTGGSLIEVSRKPEHPPFPWNNFQTTEEWSAFVSKEGDGFGVWTPGVQRYLGGFVGKTGSGGPKSSSAGYLAPLHVEILDHNIQYTYEYTLIVGSVDTIRDYVYKHRTKQTGLNFSFTKDRQHWYYRNATDSGFPIKDFLDIQINDNNPILISPWFCMEGDSVKTITVRAAFQTGETDAQLVWTKHGSRDFTAGDSIRFPVTSDGVMRDYIINLAGSTNWQGSIIRLALKPCNKGGEGKRLKLESIKGE